MKKIRVLFPYVEAGFGHIMPMKSIENAFREKYGNEVEVVASRFFTETGDRHLIRYEQMMAKQVRSYNRFPPFGFLATAACEFFGTELSSFGAMRLVSPIAYKRGVAHMEELAPDVVISTHWASNYYAERMKNKPLTVMYCPDAQTNKLFEYHSDLSLISMPYGYLKALRMKRYNVENMKLVPFLLRSEAFAVDRDKKRLRRSLGLPEDNFTVLLAEGGYGIGKMAAISELLIREHLPLTVIPVCGTNDKLFRRLQALESTPEVTFRPCGFADNMLELQAASDLFCGKSGNILAESTFFGNPSVVTHFANMIERNIADHYINTVGCTIREFSPRRVVALIRTFARDESALAPYRRAADAYREHFGAEKAADVIWEKMTERFPALQTASAVGG